MVVYISKLVSTDFLITLPITLPITSPIISAVSSRVIAVDPLKNKRCWNQALFCFIYCCISSWSDPGPREK